MPLKAPPKTILFILFTLVLTAVAWMTWNSWQISSRQTAKNVLSDLTLKNITYTKTKHGRAIWTLSAEQAVRDRGNGIIKAERIKLVFYDQRFGDIVLTADKAEIHSANETVKVMGHVRIENQPTRILTTKWMEYEENSGILKTSAPVHIVLDDCYADAKGLLIDTRERRLLLLSDVNATLDQNSLQDGSNQ